MLTVRDFLVRGLIAGLFAGVAAFVVGYVVGEPPVAASIALEESGAHTHDPGAAEEHEDSEDAGTEVPRDLQSTVGLATGMLVLGTALGGLAGIVAGLATGRFGRTSIRGTALAVAGAGFVTLYAVPFLIYPPNPPAVGSGDTIGYRSSLYFAMLAISVLGVALAVTIGRNVTPRLGTWYAALTGIGVYLVVVLVALGLMPRYDEVPAEFPASLLYQFRLASVLTQAVLWCVIGVVLAELSQRLLASRTATAAASERVGVPASK